MNRTDFIEKIFRLIVGVMVFTIVAALFTMLIKNKTVETRYELDYIDSDRYSTIEKSGSYFLVVASYTERQVNITKYTFVANNGYKKSFQINEIFLTSQNAQEKSIISFVYVSTPEEQSLLHVKNSNVLCMKKEEHYILYIQKEKVIEIAEKIS